MADLLTAGDGHGGGRDRDQAMVRVREAQQRVRSARAGALVAKRRELAAHERAIKRHEEAAAVQERFGHPDRAANAREHARHARELRELALREQREWEAQLPAGEDLGVWCCCVSVSVGWLQGVRRLLIRRCGLSRNALGTEAGHTGM